MMMKTSHVLFRTANDIELGTVFTLLSVQNSQFPDLSEFLDHAMKRSIVPGPCMCLCGWN